MLGIFDSGLGGLTVVRALKRLRPDLPIVYLADTARFPYGGKGPETIRRYAHEAVTFLKDQGAKAIIIACNTVSANATDQLRATFPQLPIFEVITPAVEAAARATVNGHVGVIATRATIASGVYEKRLKEKSPRLTVFSQPAPLLVSLVEEGWLDTPVTGAIIEKYLAPLRHAEVDTLILGCTHYPLLKPSIAALAGERMRLIDSAEATAEVFCATIEHDKALSAAVFSAGEARFYATDPTPTFAEVGSQWLGQKITVHKATL